MELKIVPIGYVRTKLSNEEVKKDSGKIESEIEIYQKYRDGLEGLDGFSHIIVISYLNRLRDFEINVLKVKPRRLIRLGFKENELPLVGVFALDSPNRPNPLAISVATVLKIDREKTCCNIKVKGLDMFDGTPVLDIKPYTPDRIVKNINLPTWYKTLLEKSNLHQI